MDESILERIMIKSLKWFGYVLGMGAERWPNKVWKLKLSAKSKEDHGTTLFEKR